MRTHAKWRRTTSCPCCLPPVRIEGCQVVTHLPKPLKRSERQTSLPSPFSPSYVFASPREREKNEITRRNVRENWNILGMFLKPEMRLRYHYFYSHLLFSFWGVFLALTPFRSVGIVSHWMFNLSISEHCWGMKVKGKKKRFPDSNLVFLVSCFGFDWCQRSNIFLSNE